MKYTWYHLTYNVIMSLNFTQSRQDIKVRGDVNGKEPFNTRKSGFL